MSIKPELNYSSHYHLPRTASNTFSLIYEPAYLLPAVSSHTTQNYQHFRLNIKPKNFIRYTQWTDNLNRTTANTNRSKATITPVFTLSCYTKTTFSWDCGLSEAGELGLNMGSERSLSLLVVCWVYYSWAMVRATNLSVVAEVTRFTILWRLHPNTVSLTIACSHRKVGRRGHIGRELWL